MSFGKLYHPLRKVVNPLAPTWEDFLKLLGRSNEQYDSFKNSIYGVSDDSPQVITPFDGPSYDTARAESDRAFKTYPLLVVYCRCVSDVVNAIKFAKMDPWIKVCVRAGGHNTAGYSVIQNGMVIDVSGMDGIIIDAENQEAIFQAGVRWGKANTELQVYNLHTPGGGCDDVGIAGFSMGGGYGYTALKYGMACDNIIGVTMVTADGTIVKASEGNDPDGLLWATKGGTGGNFGVVVDFKFRLYPIPEKVYTIELNWTIDKAAQVLTTWQNEMTVTLKDRNL
ncbi:9067_t:CDS:2, partial [Paraglomus occultum]